ncbi:hypothetical protein U0070_012129, partial [Myodes glareolus]
MLIGPGGFVAATLLLSGGLRGAVSDSPVEMRSCSCSHLSAGMATEVPGTVTGAHNGPAAHWHASDCLTGERHGEGQTERSTLHTSLRIRATVGLEDSNSFCSPGVGNSYQPASATMCHTSCSSGCQPSCCVSSPCQPACCVSSPCQSSCVPLSCRPAICIPVRCQVACCVPVSCRPTVCMAPSCQSAVCVPVSCRP